MAVETRQVKPCWPTSGPRTVAPSWTQDGIHYVFANRHRMRYPLSGPQGPCISSGIVEAGCKQIGARLKRAGMRWTVAGANAIINLRRCIFSGRFEDSRERQAANAA